MKNLFGKDMASKNIKKKQKFQTFQDTILNLQKFWSKHGCIILQPYDMEVGAGTFHPATTSLGCLASTSNRSSSLRIYSPGNVHTDE